PGKALRVKGRRIAFSSDGKALAIYHTKEGEVSLCDAKGTPRHTFEASLCNLLTFTPDGKTLVVSRWGPKDWEVARWDVATGKRLPESDTPHLSTSPDCGRSVRMLAWWRSFPKVPWSWGYSTSGPASGASPILATLGPW